MGPIPDAPTETGGEERARSCSDSGPEALSPIQAVIHKYHLFWGAPKSLQMVTVAMKLKDAFSVEEKL